MDRHVTINQGSGVQVGDNNTQIISITATGELKLADWWTGTWLAFTDPALGADVVLAGRQSEAAALRAALRGDHTVVTVDGDLGALELKAFAAAALVDTAVGDRTLLVDDPVVLRDLLAEEEPRVLAVPAGMPLGEVRLDRPHTILVYGRIAQNAAVTVPPLDGDEVERLLVAAEMEPSRARSHGVLARRGLGQLRRSLAKHPALADPEWAKAPDSRLRRLALLGGWNGRHEDDRAIVGEFVGCTYAEAAEIAGQLAAEPDTAMLGHLGQRWYLQAPEDTFVLIRRSLIDEDLTAFADLAVRLFTSGTGSVAVRRGIAESLILLAIHGHDVRIGPDGRTAADVARSVVREVLVRANEDPSYELWVSTTDVLRHLAEASPDGFLDAMQAGLDGSTPLRSRMFESERIYPSFLWTLELLARRAEHFSAAVEILADLTELDPGDNLHNRPGISLVEIFDPGLPQTNAPGHLRLRVLRGRFGTVEAVS